MLKNWNYVRFYNCILCSGYFLLYEFPYGISPSSVGFSEGVCAVANVKINFKGNVCRNVLNVFPYIGFPKSNGIRDNNFSQSYSIQPRYI